MNLTDTQKKTVIQWIADGLKLAEIQKRLGSELGVTMTYMEVRLLVDDLKLIPKDPEPPKEPALPAPAAAQPAAAPLAPEPNPLAPLEPAPAPGAANVSVAVDQITKPGAVVSGSVRFSDGQKCVWYLDQYGRFGMTPETAGYKPSGTDLQAFQRVLEAELSKLGF